MDATTKAAPAKDNTADNAKNITPSAMIGFDPDSVDWQPFGDAQHFRFHIQHVDLSHGIADVLFKFDAGQRIILHRHLALNHTFVVRGTHVIYHADGTVKERRPTGSYTISLPDVTPHSEGGGDEGDVIVLFSMRPDPGQGLYELLDDSGAVVGEITLPLLHQLWLAQQEGLQTVTASTTSAR